MVRLRVEWSAQPRTPGRLGHRGASGVPRASQALYDAAHGRRRRDHGQDRRPVHGAADLPRLGTCTRIANTPPRPVPLKVTPIARVVIYGDRTDIVALDSAIIQHPKTWEASGHLAGFTDPLVDCKTCGQRFRDHLAELPCGRKPSKHPGETPECDLTEAREFNLMFDTTIGPVKEAGAVHPRLQTAQGIFLDEAAVRHRPGRQVVPQRDARQSLRTLEFEQMEMEFFVPPCDGGAALARALARGAPGLVRASLAPPQADELSHYSSATSDVEYLYPIGWSELEGHRQPRRLRPDAACPALGREARVLRHRLGRALRPPRHRAGRGCRTVLAVLCGPTTASPASSARAASTRVWRRSRSPRCCSCGSTWSPTRSSSCCRGQAAGRVRRRAARSASATAARTRSAPPSCVTIDHQSLEDLYGCTVVTATCSRRSAWPSTSFGLVHGAARRAASTRRQLVDRDALLRERVAVAHGDRAVLERLVVDRHAQRRADLVLAAVALADRAALVVLGLHLRRAAARRPRGRARAGRPCARAAAPRP